MVKRIKKKKPAIVDKFIALPNRLLYYIEANFKKVITIGIIFILLASIFVLGFIWWQKKNKNSFLLYSQAQMLKDTNKKRAIEILNKLIKANTKAAKFARLELANIYKENRKWQRAITLYQSHLKKNGNNEYFSPFVLYTLSCLYQNLEKPLEAQKTLETLISKWPNHPLTNLAYVTLGLLLEEKNPSRALKMYQVALGQKSPLTPLWVEVKIERLRAKLGSVEAPPNE